MAFTAASSVDPTPVKRFAKIFGLDADMAKGTFVMLSSASEPAEQLVVNEGGFVGRDRSVDLPPGLAIDVDERRHGGNEALLLDTAVLPLQPSHWLHADDKPDGKAFTGPPDSPHLG